MSKNKSNNLFLSSYSIKSYLTDNSNLIRNKLKIDQTPQSEKQAIQFPGLIRGLRIRQIQQHQSSIKQITQNNNQVNLEPKRVQNSSKKILYRMKQKKKIASRNQIYIKHKFTSHKGLAIFYRNQIVSLITLMNRKDDYLNILRNKKSQSLIPLKNNQVQQLLKKQCQTKGKDKGRQKFNNLTNEQLRSIKYKPKPYTNIIKKQSKSKQQQFETVSQGQQDCEENIDFATWKRKNGAYKNQKIFIIKGGYNDLRDALIEKGWFENQNVHSKQFDLKWTTKISDINFGQLKNGQFVNHFNNNHHLTSKYGLSRRLRTLILHHNVDIDKFYPRCYDLGDQVDLQNFVEHFKFSFAESVAKRLLTDQNRYQGIQYKVKIVIDILTKCSVKFSTLINQINQGNFPIISPEDWSIITQTVDKQLLIERSKQLREQYKFENKVQSLQQLYQDQIQKLLQTFSDIDPQLCINGMHNVWIVKPNFLSRGRGIRCFNNIYDIADYCLGRQVQFVVQKYIENPLLINGKKFDIRQWILIQDYNPPKIWFYDECYLRFCGDQYSLDNINNRFMHLTNNSIQKHNKRAQIEQSMWTMLQFINHVGIEKWSIIKEKIKNIVVWSAKSCEGIITGKKGSFELVGYDFMIDQNYNPWLIEVNMSPSMDYSTNVTKRLVKQLLLDTANVISNKKQKNNSGLYTCIYRGDQDLKKFPLYNF